MPKDFLVAVLKAVAKVGAKAGLLAISTAPSLVGMMATTLAELVGQKLEILMVG